MYYLNYFFTFSILGHVLESFFYKNGESGILYGFWTPVYGIGVVLILIIEKVLDKYNIKGLHKAVLLFITSATVLSLIEASGGYLIKWVLHKELWNYTHYKFNIGRYAAVEMGLIWGGASILFVYIIKPLFNKIISKIPKFLTYICSLLFIIDFILTIATKH